MAAEFADTAHADAHPNTMETNANTQNVQTHSATTTLTQSIRPNA